MYPFIDLSVYKFNPQERAEVCLGVIQIHITFSSFRTFFLLLFKFFFAKHSKLSPFHVSYIYKFAFKFDFLRNTFFIIQNSEKYSETFSALTLTIYKFSRCDTRNTAISFFNELSSKLALK